MQELNIMLTILKECNDVDIRLIYRSMPSCEHFPHKTVIVANCKNVKNAFEKTECQVFAVK